MLARSLFIALPPPSRSSISDANSCKLPSSLRLLLAPSFAMPRSSSSFCAALTFFRGLDRAHRHSLPARLTSPLLDRSGDKPSPSREIILRTRQKFRGLSPDASIFICDAIGAEVFPTFAVYQILRMQFIRKIDLAIREFNIFRLRSVFLEALMNSRARENIIRIIFFISIPEIPVVASRARCIKILETYLISRNEGYQTDFRKTFVLGAINSRFFNAARYGSNKRRSRLIYYLF